MQNIDSIRIMQVDGLNTGAGSAHAGDATPGTSGNLAEQAVGAALKYRAYAPVVDQLIKEVGLSDGLSGLVKIAPAPAAAAFREPVRAFLRARTLATGWIDAVGNFWLFGGYGLEGATFAASIGASGLLNDLWKYEPASNTWAWLSGANVASSPSVFGTQGVPAVSNVSTARMSNAAWVDPAGAFHIYAGAGSLNSDRRLGDFWKFVPQ